jgi:hypothetical protein
MNKMFFLILLGFNSYIYSQNERQFPVLKGDYLGQTPPGDTPKVFARGIVSTDYQEHGSPSFSPDGNEVYWYSNRRPGLENKQWLSFIMTMRRENGRWSAPYVAPKKRFLIFTTDGRRAYFSSARPHSDTVQVIPPDLDIWFVERQGDDWSQPKYLNLVARYPELRWAGVGSVAGNGTLYFMSYRTGTPDDDGNNFGIYRAELVNGECTKPELLPSSINLLPFLNWTPFIAPDESYLIFSSSRGTPKNDGGDLYVSFRQPDGSWANPISLGKPINTDQQERYPRVSWDGKYLFFSRWTPDHDEDVFWVSAKIIDRLREKSNMKK